MSSTPSRVAVFALAMFAVSTSYALESFNANGTEVAYTVSGDGEPVVLIHGFMGSHKEWTMPPPYLAPSQREQVQTVFSTLANDYQAIAFDCRGHGSSGKPKDANQYGVEMVEDVVRLMDHLAIERAHIVGYSMGAFIAAKLVVTHPERVASVVLGGSGPLLEDSMELAFMESLGRSLHSGKGVEPLILAMTPPGHPAPTAEQIEQANQMILANQDQQALAQAALGHNQLTVTQAGLEANQVPALLIVGGDDPQKASVEVTHEMMAKSRLVVLDGLDHISTETSPQFLSNIQTFLQAEKD